MSKRRAARRRDAEDVWLVPGYRGVTMSDVEHRLFSIATSENSDCAAAATSRDLCAEESVIDSVHPDQPDEQVGAFRTQATRGVAVMRGVHQLAHCHLISQTRCRAQQLSELLYSGTLVNRVFRRRANRIPALTFDGGHSIRSAS